MIHVITDLLYRMRNSKLDSLLTTLGVRNEVTDVVEWVEYEANRGVVVLSVDGREIRFDTDTKQSYRSLRHLARSEKAVLGDFVNELEPSDVVFDVGAHLGLYSKTAAVCGVKSVVAFELLSANADYLRKTTPSNVRVVNKGVADESGESLVNPDDNATGNDIISLNSGNGDHAVPVTSIDEYVAESRTEATVMKIDVEGGEDAVLSGAAETVLGCRVVYVECHGTSSTVRDFLSDAGFVMTTIDERGEQEFLKAKRR